MVIGNKLIVRSSKVIIIKKMIIKKVIKTKELINQNNIIINRSRGKVTISKNRHKDSLSKKTAH